MKRLVAATITFLISFQFALATIINVPGDQPTIQEGIDASLDGDTVLVQPGTYFENIAINGESIVLGSWFLTTRDTSYLSQTVIDGAGGRAVTIEGANSFELTGFSIVNGFSDNGGGVGIGYADPFLSYLIVKDNHANYGGGISCTSSSPILHHVQVINNTAQSNAGGIRLGHSSNAYLDQVLVADNHAGNNAGGMQCFENSCPTVTRSTIVRNTAGVVDGGIEAFGAIPSLNSTIVWGNTPSDIEVWPDNGICEITIAYSDIQGGEDEIILHGDCTVNWQSGNMDQDPLFSDYTNGDYSLLFDSPCIDMGDPDLDNDGVEWQYDLDDQDPDGSRFDMGCFPFLQVLTYPRSINFGDVEIYFSELLDVFIYNNSSESFDVISVSNQLPEFTNDWTTATNPVEAGDTLVITILFSPIMEGTVRDTLVVLCDFVDPLTIQISMEGWGGIIPAAISDLSILIEGDFDVLLNWSPVTETINGTPYSPECYLVFASPYCNDPGSFTYLGSTTSTEFTHPMAALYADLLFYNVIAWGESERVQTLIPGKTAMMELLERQ